MWVFRTLVGFSFSGLMFYTMSIGGVPYKGFLIAIMGGLACWNYIEAIRIANE